MRITAIMLVLGYVAGVAWAQNKAGTKADGKGDIMPRERAYDAVLYVDGKLGQATGDGSRSRPFKTIQAALDAVRPGTRIVVKAGVYDESHIVVKQSGTEEKPILIEGERGPDGKALVTIRGGKAIVNWERAAEIGEGVYKVPSLGFKPEGMVTQDGKNLDCVPEKKGNIGSKDHDVQPCMSDGSAWPFFRSDLGLECTADNPEHAIATGLGKVRFWDVTHGIFGAANGVTYVRLKDRTDPNPLGLRAVGPQDTILIEDKSYLTVRGFVLSGFSVGLSLKGEKTHHVSVEENQVRYSRTGISISSGAHHILVRGNQVTFSYLGGPTGVWGAAKPTYEQNLKQAFYQWRHHWVFNGAGGIAFHLDQAGDDIEIAGNDIHEGMLAMHQQNLPPQVKTRRLKVHGNKVRNFSSGAFSIDMGLLDGEIYDNYFTDNNWHIRLNRLQDTNTIRVFIYNNFFHQPEEAGTHVYLHYGKNVAPNPDTAPEVYIYHNSMMGGATSIGSSFFGAPDGYLTRVYILNNIISSLSKWCLRGDEKLPSRSIGAFDYNWVGDGLTSGKMPEWLVGHNTRATRTWFWDLGKKAEFGIPEKSEALEAGLDLSKPFTLNGREFKPLPGVFPGYFKGKAPNLGAFSIPPEI